MAYLLNAIYALMLLAASPWLVFRAATTERYRQGLLDRLLGRTPTPPDDRPLVWLHAVSLGEVNLLAPVVAELQSRRPGWTLVISTTTKTGYDQARRKFPQLEVFYSPLDFSWATRAAMRRLRPRLLVLAELELWPNLIAAACEQGAAVAIINGRLSPRSFRGYRRARWLTARWLASVDCIAAQTEEYAARFRALGAPSPRVVVAGSIKFDGAETKRDNPETARLARLAGYDRDDVVFLAGSTQAPEEQLALNVYRQLRERYPRLRLALAPRHPERFAEVAELLDRSGIAWRRRSQLVDTTVLDPRAVKPAPRERPADDRSCDQVLPIDVLLIDAIGELRGWWGTARIALVGGSLSTRGGQNMIEPAAYGAAICFGPNTWNFRDVVTQLLAADAATVIHDEAELSAFVERCLRDPAAASRQGDRARALVLAQQGAARRTIDLLLPLVDRPRTGDLPKSQRHAA